MCISPITKRNHEYRFENGDSATKQVPCGKCHECLALRRNSWSFRLHHQMMNSYTSCFMTLTYGIHQDEGWGNNPPLSPNGLYTLEKSDLKGFFKRLRYYNNEEFKYYAVGEYGTISKRPHYHVIMFNMDKSLITNSLRLSKNIWKAGNVDIARCNIRTINYVVGYVMKGQFKPEDQFDDRLPEFALQSKGLGSSFLTDSMHEYLYDRMQTWVEHPSGFKIPLPRYYRDKIFTTEEKAELLDIRNQLNDYQLGEEISDKDKLVSTKYRIEKHERMQARQRLKI